MMNSVRYFVIAALLLALVVIASTQRFCCTSTMEYAKCVTLRRWSRSFRYFGCFQAATTAECTDAIKDNSADMMFLDGGDIFRYRHDLIVAAAENYGEEDASYFAVAAVKNNADERISLLDLDGVQSCHTAIGKTAGWNTPMGMIARINNRVVDGRVPLYNPFSASCAPGANNPSFQHLLPNPANHKQWCKLCFGKSDGSGENVCDRNIEEYYYGYEGAFRCLKASDGTNTVAFVKHVTVPVDEQDNFRLLCRNGSRAHPADWRTCNLAKVPSHGLVMREGTSEEDIDQILSLLRETRSEVGDFLFMHYGERENLLWKSSTVEFLGPFRLRPRDFLGDEYFCNMLVVSGFPIEDGCLSV